MADAREIVADAEELRRLGRTHRTTLARLEDVQRAVDRLLRALDRLGWDTREVEDWWREAQRHLVDVLTALGAYPHYLELKAQIVDELTGRSWPGVFGLATLLFGNGILSGTQAYKLAPWVHTWREGDAVGAIKSGKLGGELLRWLIAHDSSRWRQLQRQLGDLAEVLLGRPAGGKRQPPGTDGQDPVPRANGRADSGQARARPHAGVLPSKGAVALFGLEILEKARKSQAAERGRDTDPRLGMGLARAASATALGLLQRPPGLLGLLFLSRIGAIGAAIQLQRPPGLLGLLSAFGLRSRAGSGSRQVAAAADRFREFATSPVVPSPSRSPGAPARQKVQQVQDLGRQMAAIHAAATRRGAGGGYLALEFARQRAGQVGVDQLIASAKRDHINQFLAELRVGRDGSNADCGPTSLAIALHSLGLKVAGETDGMSNGQVVDLARASMVADPARDGVAPDLASREREHSTYTTLSEIKRGAEMAGATATFVTASALGIQKALQDGGKVVVSGTFGGKDPLPWKGDRGVDNNRAPGGATAHIIAVTGYDPASQQFIVNDPARASPLAVSGKTLEYFMQGNAGAVRISV